MRNFQRKDVNKSREAVRVSSAPAKPGLDAGGHQGCDGHKLNVSSHARWKVRSGVLLRTGAAEKPVIKEGTTLKEPRLCSGKAGEANAAVDVGRG
jgi:hypothetical protein